MLASSFVVAMEFPFSLDSSTGYLQDAITELSERSKRRRVTISSSGDQTTIESENLVQVNSNSMLFIYIYVFFFSSPFNYFNEIVMGICVANVFSYLLW